MAQGVTWIGGDGDFDDPSNWSSSATGDPSGSPATPPGAGLDAQYLEAGTVTFTSDVSNGEADINASMVFDLSGGDYSLTGIGGNQGLQFDVGAIGSFSPDLTVTGGGELTTAGLNAANAASITVTGSATFDVTGSATTFLVSAMDVDSGGLFEFQSSLNLSNGLPSVQASLTLDGGSVSVAGGFTSSAGATISASSSSTMAVTGAAAFGTGDIEFSDSSKLSAASLTLDSDTGASDDSSLTLTGADTSAVIAGSAFVGAATLNIDDGALFQAQSMEVDGTQTSGATVDLSGSESSLAVSQDLVVGDYGAAALSASEGASITVDGSMTIAQMEGSSGDVTIDDASLVVKGDLMVNDSMTISSGATVGAAVLDVGGSVGFDEATGDVSDAKLSVGTMILGGSAGAAATLTVASGGLAQVTGASVSNQPTFIKNDNATLDLDGGALTVGPDVPATDDTLTVGQGGFAELFGSAPDFTGNVEVAGGYLELVTTGAAGSSDISFGSGAGTIEVASDASLTNPIDQFAAGDTIRLDGVTANEDSFDTSDHVLTLLNGTTTVATLQFVGSYNPAEFAVNEVGGDAVVTYGASSITADILWRNPTTGGVELWIPNGAGGFTYDSLPAVNPSWHIAGTGDFNGAGGLGVLWSNASTGGVELWNSNGSGGFTYESLSPVNTSWQVAGTGDFTGSGADDILWRNTSTGGVELWNSNGSGGFTYEALSPVNTSWQVAGTGDFTGSGADSIVWRNASTGAVELWNPNGSGGFTYDSLGVVSTSWQIFKNG
jgi:hypothetical protein